MGATELLSTLCVFSVIVPSYVVYVKRPPAVFRTVEPLRETGSEVVIVTTKVGSARSHTHFLPCNAG